MCACMRVRERETAHTKQSDNVGKKERVRGADKARERSELPCCSEVGSAGLLAARRHGSTAGRQDVPGSKVNLVTRLMALARASGHACVSARFPLHSVSSDLQLTKFMYFLRPPSRFPGFI